MDNALLLGLLAEVDVTTIMQFTLLMSVLLVPMVLFAWYKFASNKRRHALKLARLERGIVSAPGPSKGPKWCRSIYLGVFFCIVSAFFAYGFFSAESDPAGLGFAVLLGLGALFLTRGILKRTSWIKHLALQSGVPFERVFPIKPRRALWITSFAIGLPLLGFAWFIYQKEPFSTHTMDAVVVGLSLCLGGALFLHGILLAWYLRREDKPALRNECSEPVLSETV